MATEPIILNTAEEREFWKATFIASYREHVSLKRSCIDADAAVYELRARMPVAAAEPTYPPGEEPRVVQCEDGLWDIVCGPHSKAGWTWGTSIREWVRNVCFDKGRFGSEGAAKEALASLTPAQLAAPVGVEVRA